MILRGRAQNYMVNKEQVVLMEKKLIVKPIASENPMSWCWIG